MLSKILFSVFDYVEAVVKNLKIPGYSLYTPVLKPRPTPGRISPEILFPKPSHLPTANPPIYILTLPFFLLCKIFKIPVLILFSDVSIFFEESFCHRLL